MGFVRKTTGIDLTGGGQVSAASKAAKLQQAGIERGQEALRSDLAPFRETGAEAANLLLSSVFAPTAQTADQVLQDPFFQALAQNQAENVLSQRAALGLGGSGSTEDALTRNLLQLGQGFRMNMNQQRFNQLMNIAGLGQASAAQTGAAAQRAQTEIGGLQGVSPLAQANQSAQLGQQVMGGLGMLSGGIGGIPGMLGSIGGMFGGGSAIPPPVFSGGAGMGRFGTGSIGL